MNQNDAWYFPHITRSVFKASQKLLNTNATCDVNAIADLALSECQMQRDALCKRIRNALKSLIITGDIEVTTITTTRKTKMYVIQKTN